MRLLGALVLAVSSVAFAAPVERRLHFAQVDASSFLFNNWNRFQENYHPMYLGDDDPTTAWVEGQKGPGVGEWVRLRITAMKGATKVRLRIRNGYQKTPKLFTANARARSVTITLMPSKVKTTHELADKDGWQEVVIDQPEGALESVEVKIGSVYPGTKYEDLCISDMQLFATATSADNPSFEKARFEQILAWKKARVDAAKAFKQASRESMPVAPQYQATEDKDTADFGEGDGIAASLRRLAADRVAGKSKGRIAALTALAETADKSFVAVQVVATDKRPVPRVDGLCTPDMNSCEYDLCHEALSMPLSGQLGFLRAEQLALFDLKKGPLPSDVLARKAPACKRKETTHFAWVHRGAPGPDGKERIDAVLLGACGLTESREGWDPSSWLQLVSFGADGLAEVIADKNSAELLRWSRGVLDGGRLVRGTGDATLDVVRVTEVAAQ